MPNYRPKPSDSNRPTKRVVLTRPLERQEVLANTLRQSGCDVLELAALTISPIEPAEHLFSEAARTAWQPVQYDVLVFVSRAAWQNYVRFYLDQSYLVTWKQGPKRFTGAHCPPMLGQMVNERRATLTVEPILACVGTSTAQQIARLLNWPLSAVLFPTEGYTADSEGLWSVLQPQLAPKSKILIVRGDTGRDWLAQTLAREGMSVTSLAVYRREAAIWSQEQLCVLRRWASGDGAHQTGTWLITSAQGLDAIEHEYERHGLTGRAGFCPEEVIVVHERLVAPVSRWLQHWQACEGASDRTTAVRVVAPDDAAIAAAILRSV